MTQVQGFNDKVSFIWSVADLLRGEDRRHEYGQVILPLTVLRRLDCVLKPTKDAVVARASTLIGKVGNVDPILLRTAKQPFYNISTLDFERLLDDAPNLAANLRAYIAAYSTGAVEVLDKYGFDNQITRLDNAGLLFHVVSAFADVDLHPDTVPNEAMGYIFEELLRKFSEMSNETAGEHFTPREVIQLMVNILFSEDDDALRGTAPVRTIFDPACGTGGMLTGGQEHMRALNPRARLEVFGQELNPETWAIARSDLMIKGQDPTRIQLGNSLSADEFTGQTFDYMLANPPFGVDWKRIERQIRDEKAEFGAEGRFGAGLPRVSDGSLLFLQHMIDKMKPKRDGGSRIAIVFSGSPLFSGGAGSGESEIRRWIIESDWLEGIVALPDQMFYNTGINTYFWIVTNRKAEHRKGKVALIDARGEWAKMRKSLGDKRKYVTAEKIDEITRLYHHALDEPDGRVKIFNNDDFGYQRITVEQPLRRRWTITEAAIEQVRIARQFQVAEIDHAVVLDAMRALLEITEDTEAAFTKRLLTETATRGQSVLPAPVKKVVVEAAAVADPTAEVITGRKGVRLPDPDLRDNENVPLTEDIDSYMQREILPHAPDAWVDPTKTKTGFEIPFTRLFYTYVPARPIAEIDADIDRVEIEIQQLLKKVAR
ncbi:type I restriction-modification system subunit M [Pseudonocardia saturnea]